MSGKRRYLCHNVWGMREGEIIDIVRNRFAGYQFTVEELARETGIGVSHLREKVHLQYHMCPQELIETVRLEESLIRISANHTQNLYEVYSNVGYLSLRTFLDAFKRRLGVTPTECRNALCTNGTELKKWVAILWTDGQGGKNSC